MRTSARQTKVEQVVQKRQETIVVLEDIHDPHNAQAVIRSCDCFGVQQIYFVFAKEKTFNPIEVGKLASSSANKWLDYKIFDSTEECFAELKKQGYKILTTVISDQVSSIYDYDFTQSSKLALCLGNEHSGLSEYAVANSDAQLTIPMFGMIQSLNLSVTAAVFLFEMTRQRVTHGYQDFVLPKLEQEELFKRLIEK